jgi:hypothetical protein
VIRESCAVDFEIQGALGRMALWEAFMLGKTRFALIFVFAASHGVLACSSSEKDVHVPVSSNGSMIGGGQVGAACTGGTGDGTDTTECPYYACYCKSYFLCTDWCNGSVCQDADKTCAYVCTGFGGVDHTGPATTAVCN